MEVVSIELAPPDTRAPTHQQGATLAPSSEHTRADKSPPAAREGGGARRSGEGGGNG